MTQRFLTPLLSAVAAVALALAAPSCSRGADEAALPSPAGIYERVSSTDKMVFASMTLTKTATLDSSKWYKIGKRIAVYSYDTFLRAYIDLAELTPDDITVDNDARTIALTLPPVVTEVAGRDMEMRKVYENIGLLRSDLDSRERAMMKERANESLRREIAAGAPLRSRLESAAQAKARDFFKALLEPEGYAVEITFRNR